MKIRPICHIALTALLLAGCISTGQPEKQSPIEKWRSYKYGMFIHFGMATYTGRQSENDPKNAQEPSSLYAPTDLDVDQWIKTARDAGMKYAVLTAKHTAGHCLWDSKVQFRGKEFDHDVETSGDKTDVVAEFMKACKKYDVAPGIYWCLLDFRNNSAPGWKGRELPADFFKLAKDQFSELLNNYPEIEYMWIDIPRAATKEQRIALYNYIKNIKSDCVVLMNHGTRVPSGGMTIDEYQAAWPTDILNSERHPLKGEFDPGQTWEGKEYELGYEHCDTICKKWFWFKGDGPRPPKDLYDLYTQVTAAGGSFLLNVPPDKTGKIPDYHVKRLMEIKKMIDNPPQTPITQGKKAAASNFYENDKQYEPARALDGSTGTRWATDDGITSPWLEVDLGKSMTFQRAVILHAYPELKRVKKFQIEYKEGKDWKAFYQGENLGPELDVSFKPVTAQHVRLNITEGKDGPTIWEFQLYEK